MNDSHRDFVKANLFTAVLLVCLLAAAGWVVFQGELMATYEQQNAVLKRRLATGPSDVSARPNRPVPKTPFDTRPVDWKEVAKELGNNEGGYGYLRTARRLDEGFLSMSFEELTAAVDEIEAADLSESDREMLMQKIRAAIFENDPELGLARFIHRYYDANWGFPLSSAFAAWAKRDPQAAVAWFEEHLAAGSFDARKPDGSPAFPNRMARAAIFSLLATAPETAGRLLSTVPENERLGTLGSIELTRLNEKTYAAWADLVRNHLSETEHLKAIAWPTQN